MNKKLFVFTLFTIFTLVTIAMYSGHAHEAYPADDDSLPSSEYADVHGSVKGFNNKRIHIHGIAYANFDRKGNYTVDLTVNEHENHRQGRENFQGDVHEQSSFKTGIRMERKIAFEVANLDLDTIGWTASSTLEIEKPNENVLHRDYDEKKIRDLIENLDWEDEEDHELPKFGLSPTDPDSPEPGDRRTFCLVTDAGYHSVYFYVNPPWGETGSLGTNECTVYCEDGTATEVEFNYTFPSGAMHTGTFTITAYIYRADQSVYEETCTIDVTLD